MKELQSAIDANLIDVDKKELTPEGIKTLMDLIDGVTDAILESPLLEIKGTEEQFREDTKNIFFHMFGSSYETFVYLYPHRFDFNSLVEFHLGKNGELQ